VDKPTLESLARRVEALECALALKLAPARKKDWRRVVGMFGDSEFKRQVDAEGQAIRTASWRSCSIFRGVHDRPVRRTGGRPV
jgi:hypothetical protein